MPVHLERTGSPPDLPAAVEHFVVHRLRGRLLDDRKDEESKLGKFPDFACYRDLVLIEMKHLEAEQKERIIDTYQKRVIPEEAPFFYGSRRMNFDGFSNSDEIQRAIVSKLARTIEEPLRKANSQFKEYRERNPRKNSVSICLILNSQIDEFNPDIVMYSVLSKMQPTATGVRFPHIDAVVYLSEKHAKPLPDGRMGFGIVHVIGPSAEEQIWKVRLTEHIFELWSEFRTGGPSIPMPGPRPEQFESIEDVPPVMKRHEMWKLEYRRNPYLRGKTDHQLKVHFHRCMGFSLLYLTEGDWKKPTPEQRLDYMRAFGDTIEEINHRGIDMRELSPQALSPEDRQQAYAGLPEELVQQL